MGHDGYILYSDHRDRESNEGVDVFGMRSHHSGNRQRKSDAVTNRKTGHDEHQVAQSPRDQYQAQQKRHVIRAGQNVLDADTDVLQEALVAHLRTASVNIDIAMIGSE